jgi:hypothetical protein
VIERIESVAGDFLALGEDSPNSTGPALAVLAYVVERYDSDRETFAELIVLAERAGRLAVLARLDRDELDVCDDDAQVELRLGKLELAPGRAALQLIRQQRYRDDEVQETSRELALYLVDDQTLAEVAGLELLQEERGQEEVDGRLVRYASAVRGRLDVDPRLAGGLYRLVLTTHETESEDGKRVLSERQREVLCFDGAEFSECEE